MASMSYKPITYTEDMGISSIDDTEDKKKYYFNYIHSA